MFASSLPLPHTPFLRPHSMEWLLFPREACKMIPTLLPELFELIYNSDKRGQSLIKLNRPINYTKRNKHNEHKNLQPSSQVQMCPLVWPWQVLQSSSILMLCRTNSLWLCGGGITPHSDLKTPPKPLIFVPQLSCSPQSSSVQVSTMVTASWLAAQSLRPDCLLQILALPLINWWHWAN